MPKPPALTRHNILLSAGMFKELSDLHGGLPSAMVIRTILEAHVAKRRTGSTSRPPLPPLNIDIEKEPTDEPSAKD